MQEIHDARRVVVLIETPTRRYGWEVFEPGPVKWDFTGLDPIHGTKATMSVNGVFHRMQTEALSPFDEHTRLWADEIRGEIE